MRQGACVWCSQQEGVCVCAVRISRCWASESVSDFPSDAGLHTAGSDDGDGSRQHADAQCGASLSADAPAKPKPWATLSVGSIAASDQLDYRKRLTTRWILQWCV